MILLYDVTQHKQLISSQCDNLTNIYIHNFSTQLTTTVECVARPCIVANRSRGGGHKEVPCM